MHDVLRQRLLRKIESLPDDQIYQVLDYIEFLESKYVTAEGVSTSGLQKFAEGLEDKLRRRAVSPSTIREAFQLISAADRVLSGVSSAGRQILDDLGGVLEVDDGAQKGGARADADQAASGRSGSGPESSGQAGGGPTGGGTAGRAGEASSTVSGETQRFEADPRKRRAASSAQPSPKEDPGSTGAGSDGPEGDGTTAR